MFPSNVGKQCYFLYDDTSGAERFVYYKPASRATIAEKKQGDVESENQVMSTEISLGRDYGLNHDARLVDAIRKFNQSTYNNVLKLQIVDLDGNDVTNTKEVYDIPLGVMYPGVYFVGRNKSLCKSITETEFHITKTSDSLPYSNFSDPYFRRLKINTDVAQNLPIYFGSVSKMRDSLRDTGIVVSKAWDFLDVSGSADKAFQPDTLDYEETNLSSFEIYKRLGSGFATTAHAEKRVNSTGQEIQPRVRETKLDDPNHTVAVSEGIYSVLQDAQIKYRVLACANADQKISGKLPRYKDFEKAMARDTEDALNGYIRIIPKINSTDRTAAKKYSFIFHSVATAEILDISTVDESVVYPVITEIASISDTEAKGMNAPNGTLIMAGSGDNGRQLYHADEDGVTLLDSSSFEGKTYLVNGHLFKGVLSGDTVQFDKVDPATLPAGKTTILGSILNHVFAYTLKEEGGVSSFEPIGDFATLISENDEDLIVYAQDLNYVENKIIVKSENFHNITMEELVDLMNKDDTLSRLFEFELTSSGAEVKDDFVGDLCETILADDVEDARINEDREVGYDYNLYIPYRTTDNFARQLAQHCTYTEIRTTPAWGFIGCDKLANVGLASVATKVKSVMDLDFDMYAKNNYGRNMLDRNNMPYPIGKNISVVFSQYGFNSLDSSYYYTSNGAAGYAGMVTTLPLDQSSTAQSIDISELDFNLTQSQLLRLTEKGIVTFRRSFTKGIVVTDGITMAPADSVFRRLSASRIVGAIEDLIREACEPYIGKQNHAANRNSLYTAIKSKLDKLVGTLVETYDFSLSSDPNAAQFSYILINYKVVPIYEIREVRNTIKVTDSLTN